jgi:hypothetical protein
MRNLTLAAAMAPIFLLSGCGQSVVGKYQCDGIPGMDALELRDDGTAVQSGDMLGHHVAGTGTYTAAGASVTVKSDVKTFDMTDGKAGAVLDEHQDETAFEKQGNGDLKWVLATCKKL